MIFSDGVNEAKDERGRLFGQQGVIAAVTRAGLSSPEEIVDEILNAARRHTGSDDPDDDQALLVIQIGDPAKATGLRSTLTLMQKEAGEGSLEFSLINAADSGSVSYEVLRERLYEWTKASGCEQGQADDVWVATWEALQNAVGHGSNRGDEIIVGFYTGSAPGVEVQVTQPIPWERWDEDVRRVEKVLSKPGPHLDGGGVAIMLNSSYEVTVLGRGRTVRLRFACGGSSDGKKGVA